MLEMLVSKEMWENPDDNLKPKVKEKEVKN